MATPAAQDEQALATSLLQSVADHLQADEQQLCTTLDATTALRFYRAAGGNTSLAVKRLVATARWRAKHKPEKITCTSCSSNPNAHYMHCCGFDRQNRPVLYSSHIMIEDASANASIDHMIAEFERAVRLMPAGVESWVWIMHFQGFGTRLADFSPTLALKFQELSSQHYPERLGALWVVDAPSVMNPLWELVKPLMDRKTHDKIRFLRCDVPDSFIIPAAGDVTATQQVEQQQQAPLSSSQHTTDTTPHLWQELVSLTGEETAAWIIREMRHTKAWDILRSKKKSKGSSESASMAKPCYDVCLLHKAVSSGQLASLPVCSDGHSHYGTQTLLNKLIKQPDALLPLPVPPKSSS